METTMAHSLLQERLTALEWQNLERDLQQYTTTGTSNRVTFILNRPYAATINEVLGISKITGIPFSDLVFQYGFGYNNRLSEIEKVVQQEEAGTRVDKVYQAA